MEKPRWGRDPVKNVAQITLLLVNFRNAVSIPSWMSEFYAETSASQTISLAQHWQVTGDAWRPGNKCWKWCEEVTRMREGRYSRQKATLAHFLSLLPSILVAGLGNLTIYTSFHFFIYLFYRLIDFFLWGGGIWASKLIVCYLTVTVDRYGWINR